jgi:hypothetical protein
MSTSARAGLLLSPFLIAALFPLAAQTPQLATDEPAGSLEVVATFPGPMPTGVTVSHHGRIYVNFPRWGDDVPFTVAEVKDGNAVAFPNADINRQDNAAAASHFISVQSVVVDPVDRRWVLDTGAPMLKDVVPHGPKLRSQRERRSGRRDRPDRGGEGAL